LAVGYRVSDIDLRASTVLANVRGNDRHPTPREASMRLGGVRGSGNVEDRRGMGRGLVGGGRGAVVIAIVAMFFGVDPSVILQNGEQAAPTEQIGDSTASDAGKVFVEKVLATTETTWAEQFQRMGRTYQDPTLVLFSGMVQSACGTGQAAMGPFYCPLDGKVYIDLSFYDELRQRFQAPGDFAQAYVIAHEVGHHVQNLLGISEQVHQAEQAAGSRAEANALSVKLELQADCLAGVWGHDNQQILDPGDVEEALTAASAIGDDRLQREARGTVVPESFTHGTSEQRMSAFQQGFQSGNPAACGVG
jgi:predicted metalloprotease